MILGKIAAMIETYSIYKEAWAQLYNAFGERMQTEELELMDAVLQRIKIDYKEQQDALQNEAADQIPET